MTQKLEGNFAGQSSELQSLINGAISQLSALVKQFDTAAIEMGETVNDILEDSLNLTTRTKQQTTSLAARTQSSTYEIEEMVGRLQVGAVAVVTVMNEGRERAKNSVEKAAQAATALDSITAMISKMDEMSAAIYNAASEQSAVAEDINKGIVKIGQVAEHTAEGAHQSSEAVSTMSSLSEQLQEAAGKFKV